MRSTLNGVSCGVAMPPVAVEPKVFDLLAYVIENRERVVSRDDLIAHVWGGRIVSEAALARCINGARNAIGDSGEAQRLIKTLQRKGLRFVGVVREEKAPSGSAAAAATGAEKADSCLAPPRPAVDRRAAARQPRRRQGRGLFF